jgi:short-subunit dehydrogenase
MSLPSFETSFAKTYHKKPYLRLDPTQPSVSAAGKTILITAGHTGIGFSIAQNFTIAGASHVILLARRAEVLQAAAKELSTAHPKTQFHLFVASITDAPKIKEVFSEIRSQISSNIDVLVTSAALIASSGDALDTTSEELTATFDTNFFANVNLVKEFLADISQLESSKEKVILDISSEAAHIVIPKTSAYGISKLAFTQWLAHVQQDMADKPLRIHSFHPGAVLTDAARGFGMTEESLPWDDVQLPGQFAVWLASNEATFLKGRFVWGNWDVEELVARKAEFESNKEFLKIVLKGN